MLKCDETQSKKMMEFLSHRHWCFFNSFLSSFISFSSSESLIDIIYYLSFKVNKLKVIYYNLNENWKEQRIVLNCTLMQYFLMMKKIW